MVLERVKKSLTMLGVVAGMATLVACGSDNNMPTAPNPSPTPTPAAAADVTITIKSMSADKSYDPNPADVKIGQTVAWKNADTVAHTATGTGWDTGTINPGATSAPIAFNTAGTFDYHCSIHPSMVGTLNVK